MSNRIGHNNPPVDGYDDFDPDFGRALRFALMDPKLAGELSPEQRHVGQIVGNYMCKNGKDLKLGVRKIAYATGYCKTMVAKYIIGLRIWHYINVSAPSKKGGTTTFDVQISKEMALGRWSDEQRKKQQLEREVSALEADGREAQLSAPRPDSSAEVSTPVPDSRYEASAPTVHFQAKSVRSDPKSVHPRNGHTLLDSKSLAELGDGTSQSENNSNVIPISNEAEMIKCKLEPFGEHGHRWAVEFAKFFGMNSLLEAADRMFVDAMSAGPYNVVEAIREARNVQDVRSPEGLWNAILGQMVKKFGYRAMPQQADMAPKEQSRQSKEMAQIKAITGEQ